MPLRKLFYLLTLAFSCSVWGQNNPILKSKETFLSVDKGKLTIEESRLIKIDGPESNWISKVSVHNSKRFKSEIIEASILNSSGTVVRKLKKADILIKSDIESSSLYEDNYVREFDLKWHEYPHYLHFRYRVTAEEYASLVVWLPIDYHNVPSETATLRLSIPVGYEIRVFRSGEFEFQSDTLENRIECKWTTNKIAPKINQPYSPDYTEVLPFINIVPLKFTSGGDGSFESWKTYGQWMTTIIDGLDELPVVEKIKIDRLVAGITDKQELVHTLYQYLLQNTRYIYVGIGEGGFTPFPAEYVSMRRYGDCKALTIYMKALLKHVGVESFYTLVNSGAHPPKLKVDFPNDEFDHVILCVPDVNGDTIWLENTALRNPTGYLGTFTQGRYGLLANGVGSRLVHIPPLEIEDVMVTSKFYFELSESGDGKVVISRKSRGPLFEDYNEVSLFETASQVKDYLEDNLPLKNFEVETFRFNQSSPNKPEINLETEGFGKGLARAIGKNYLVELPQTIELPKLGLPEARTTPIRIDFPENKTDSVFYDFPFLDFKLNVPESVMIESDFGSFTMNFAQDSSKIVIVKKFILRAGDWQKEEYPDFYNFLESVRKYEKTSLYLRQI